MPCLLAISAEFLLYLEVNSTTFYSIKNFHILSLKCPIKCHSSVSHHTVNIHICIIMKKWVIDIRIQILFKYGNMKELKKLAFKCLSDMWHILLNIWKQVVSILSLWPQGYIYKMLCWKFNLNDKKMYCLAKY